MPGLLHVVRHRPYSSCIADDTGLASLIRPSAPRAAHYLGRMSWTIDLERIARSEAETIAATALVMARTCGSVAIQRLHGGYLIALGPGRYVNRAVGVGRELSDEDLDTIESFYAIAGTAPSVQLTSVTGDVTLHRMSARDFGAEWFRWALAARISETRADSAGPAEIAEVDDASVSDWMGVLACANGAEDGEARSISNEYAAAAHGVEGSIDLLARVDGLPVACGSIEFAEGIAWLGGAATIPSHRGRGLQRQLLGHRIRKARDTGVRLVAATAEPGSVSARNLVRMGLRLVDAQVVMTRPAQSAIMPPQALLP